MPNDLNTNLALLLNGLGAMPGGSVGVRLSTQASAAGVANSGVAETDLLTYTLPANGLNSNGQAVRVTVWGALANTGNTKTVKVYCGATVIASLSGATANVAFFSQSTVIRVSATGQIAYGSVDFGALALFNRATASPAETLSGAVVIKVTGQSNVASSDVTALAMIVEWLP